MRACVIDCLLARFVACWVVCELEMEVEVETETETERVMGMGMGMEMEAGWSYLRGWLVLTKSWLVTL